MKFVKLFSCVAFVSSFALTAAETAPDQKQMEEAMKLTQPGPVHTQMAKLAGEYTTVTKAWMDPAKPATETKGAAKLTSVLGGRFLQEEDSGEMMGQSFSGLHLSGYNNATKKYEATWAWTMSTSMLTMTGESKDDGKTITYTATFTGEMQGKQTFQIKVSHTDDDHFAVSFYMENAAADAKPMMQIEYTRKK